MRVIDRKRFLLTFNLVPNITEFKNGCTQFGNQYYKQHTSQLVPVKGF